MEKGTPKGVIKEENLGVWVGGWLGQVNQGPDRQ